MADDRERVTGRTGDVRRAYDASPFPMAATAGPDHVYVACNTAFRLLAGASGLIGRRHADVVPGATGRRLGQVLDRIWTSHEPMVVRGLHAEPYHDADGAMAGIQLTQVGATEPMPELETGGNASTGRSRRKQPRTTEPPGLVTAMQDALLPADLPVVPDLDLSARYLLANEGGSGGDWFDAVVRPDGRVALLVGDVVGHGVAASAAMGQLRAVLRGQLLVDRPLRDVMEEVDRFARWELDMQATTVCVVLLDVVLGDIEYCTAGHPPPLVVGRDGEARYLAPSGAAPLATTRELTCDRDTLGEGDLVLLYTDGLVERPGRTLAEGTVELSEVARLATARRRLGPDDSPRAVERLCDSGVELLTSTTGYADDVTLLAAQRQAPAEAFSASFDATLAGVPAARDAVSRWLAPLEISAVDDLAIRHAVGELVTNAVVHARAGEGPTPRRRVGVDVELGRDGVLTCRVHDDGHWRGSGSSTESWGLAMVTAMVDDLRIDRSHGTTATFRLRLTRTTSLMAGGGRGSAGSRRVDFAVRHEGPRVRVDGDVDCTNAELLRTALLRAWRGGLEDVVVDLSDVTLLGSSAVRVLHESVASGRRVTLTAPMGSVAQQVLELVRLPYDTGADAVPG